MTVTAQLHDGRTLEFPDGTDPSVVQATVKKVLGVSAPAPQAPQQAQSAPPQEPSTAQKIAANPVTRFALGAASPFLGMAELIPGPTGEAMRRNNQSLKGMIEAGKEGSNVGDYADMVGNMLSPAALKVMKAMPAATGLMGRIGGGALVGAGSSAVSMQGEKSNEERGKDALIAGAIGGAIPVGIEGVKAAVKLGGNIVGPMRESWQTSQGRDFLEKELGITGDTKQKVIDAIANAKSISTNSPLTVADAIAAKTMGGTDKFGGGLVATQEALSRQGSKGIADTAKTIAAEQEAARASEIAKIARGPVEADAARRARSATALPIMREAIADANYAGKLQPQLDAKAQGLADIAESKVADVRRISGAQQVAQAIADKGSMNLSRNAPYMEVGNPRVSGRYGYGSEVANRAEGVAQKAADDSLLAGDAARFAKTQAESLANSGFKPLTPDAIVSKISGIQRGVGNVTNEPLQLAMNAFKEKLAIAKDKNGIVPAEELHTIRKQAGDWIQKAANPNNDPNKRVTAAVEKQVVGMIDDAINGAAGNDRWSKFLKTYADMSKPLDRMDVGGTLKDALISGTGAERQSSFATAVRKVQDTLSKRNNAPLIDSLTHGERDSVNRVSQEIMRDAERDALGKGVDVSHLFEIADKGKGAVTIPHLISRPASIANFVMRTMGKGADEKIAQDMGNLMLTDLPAFSKKYLEAVPVSQRELIIQELMKKSRYAPSAAAGVAVNQGDK
jgi:hypothetical protein